MFFCFHLLYFKVFDGVSRLGNLYVRICNAGCTLFQHWKARFYCNRNRAVHSRIEFGQDNKHVLTGAEEVKGKTGGVLHDINELCKFMEDCLSQWLERIGEMRTQLYYLNHYTTEQLVILQNELAKVNSDRAQVSPCVYPLLSAIRSDCSLHDIERAMRSGFRELADTDRDHDLLSNKPDDAELLGTEADFEVMNREAEQRDAVIETLIGAGYSESLARRAIEAVGVDCENEDGLIL